MTPQIRGEIGSDSESIAAVIHAAFGDVQGREIAELVADLLRDPTAEPCLSLVAAFGDRVIGHVLFTNTSISGTSREVRSAILAPLAVHPEYQNQGIGGRLIAEGLKQLSDAGVELVFVLGDPDYYSKHGFSPAGVKGFDAPYPIPTEHADAWMVQELRPGAVNEISGRVICADALNDPKHWVE